MCVCGDRRHRYNKSSATSSHDIYLRFILFSSHPRYITQAVPPPLSLANATLCTCLIACIRATLSAHLITLDAMTPLLNITQYLLSVLNPNILSILYSDTLDSRDICEVSYIIPKFLSPLFNVQCG